MAKLTWLASYPKSGNTWTRILLANYAADGAANIDALGRYGMIGGFSRTAFDRHCAFKSSTLPHHVVERLRPGVFRAMAAQTSTPLVVKLHECWHKTDRGEPLFPTDATAGVIYVIRNVLDVAPSLADHRNVDHEAAVAQLCDPDYAAAVSADSLSPGVRQFLSSWSEHVQSWLDRSGVPVLLVRYEDLLADSAGTLSRMVTFLGWDNDPTRIERAAANARFSQLKEREAAQGFRERPHHAKTVFFRRGRAGTGREELAPHLVRKLIDAHGDTMRRFGYDDATQREL